MKRSKSIYEQPRRYAKKFNVPIQYAREICKKQVRLLKDIRKNSKCPYCGERELELEYSDAEYSSKSWIICCNCYREIDESLHKHVRVYGTGEDFDVIMWASLDESMEFTPEEWLDFIKENK